MESTTQRNNPTIVVAGDPTVDWSMTVPGDGSAAELNVSYLWEMQTAVGLSVSPGGAALISQQLEAAAATEGPAIHVVGLSVPADALISPFSRSTYKSYTVWQPTTDARHVKEPVWRLARFLGRAAGDPQSILVAEPHRGPRTTLVVDDTNSGARDRPFEKVFALDGESRPRHVILRATNPLAKGSIWEALATHVPDQLTLCIGVGDIRKEHAAIGQALSWERTAYDVARAMRSHPELLRAARVVINIGTSEAVLVERDGKDWLIYDPNHQEGDWETKRGGVPFGVGICLAATLAMASALDPEGVNWLDAIRTGLVASREAIDAGPALVQTGSHMQLTFPYERVAQVMRTGDSKPEFQTAPIPLAAEWRLFTHAFGGEYGNAASAIAIEGDTAAAKSLPVERMGAWSSVDRTEIESMRSLRNIVSEYLSQPRRGRPLNLAVFGPPGSGKSFAIKQMAKQWSSGPKNISILEFNVAQFADTSNLPAALQRVRDCAVEETIPLVFWDEFDSSFGGRELGWLAAFLAPMQDGMFLEAGVPRPIGPAIFIFAGGTHPTMERFKTKAVTIPGAKATDFLSRLRGYVDILGPNASNADDQTYLLRRALLLRAVLRQKAPRMFADTRLNIDPGVLRAFLHVDQYVHGSRSMESIVDMSTIAGALRYQRSALPAPHQLALHVDPSSFLGLVHQEQDLPGQIMSA